MTFLSTKLDFLNKLQKCLNVRRNKRKRELVAVSHIYAASPAGRLSWETSWAKLG